MKGKPSTFDDQNCIGRKAITKKMVCKLRKSGYESASASSIETITVLLTSR